MLVSTALPYLAFIVYYAPTTPMDEAVVERQQEKVAQEFERRGVEFAKGYLAARLGWKPRWLRAWILKAGHLASAAGIVLTRHGIDPLSCGKELWASLDQGSEDAWQEVKKEFAQRT